MATRNFTDRVSFHNVLNHECETRVVIRALFNTNIGQSFVIFSLFHTIRFYYCLYLLKLKPMTTHARTLIIKINLFGKRNVRIGLYYFRIKRISLKY